MEEFPLWLVPLRDNLEWKREFNKWIDEAVRVYAEKALWATKEMDQLHGLRYAAGELKALQAMVNYQEIEMERVQHGS